MRRHSSWSFRTPDPDCEGALSRNLSISPLTARVLSNRGIRSATEGRSFLDAALSTLSPTRDFTELPKAVERLTQAIEKREHIVVYGDYDVDGLTGAGLLYHFLRVLGASVEVYVPDRLKDGYGFHEGGVRSLLERRPAVVVTVDHGVTAYEPVERLQAAGIDVIVTDHHQKPARLPAALALINPLLLEEGHPARRLAGAGVAFKLACGLYEVLPQTTRRNGRVRQVLREGLAFAALGTVADVVPLVGENRVLVRHGLELLPQATAPGLRALCAVAGLADRPLEAMDVAFSLGPRLNAAGRLGRVDLARQLLLTDDEDEARQLSSQLEQLNRRRREIEGQVLERARELQAQRPQDEPVLVLADPGFHAGVIGIVAARLVGEFDRPAILVNLGPDRGRGSGRSPPGFDLARALRGVGHLLRAHGGHAAAAGFEIEPTRVDALREALCEYATGAGAQERPPSRLEIDSEVHLHQIDGRLLRELRRVAPFGEGNPDPVFAASGVEPMIAPRRVGQDGSHLLMKLRAGSKSLPAIGFGLGDRLEEIGGSRFSLAFSPRSSAFRGGAPELVVKDLRCDAASR